MNVFDIEMLRRDAKKRTLCLFTIRSSPQVNEAFEKKLSVLVGMKSIGMLSEMEYEHQYCVNLLNFSKIASHKNKI